jgi:hypothetical protein
MKRAHALWALAFINLFLLAALCIKYGYADSPALAQRAAGRSGDYTLLPAKANNAPNGVVYMLDSRNARLSAFVYDHNRGSATPLKPVDLNRVFQPAPARNP